MTVVAGSPIELCQDCNAERPASVGSYAWSSRPWRTKLLMIARSGKVWPSWILPLGQDQRRSPFRSCCRVSASDLFRTIRVG